jgi:ubiquinone/menaquinone biosynthesis C-methylase UbiE
LSDSHFDSIATVYDEWLPAHVVEHYLDKRSAFIRAHCPAGKGLDVGCGTGTLAARLAAAGYEMTGVDPSAGMLDVMRSSHPVIEAARADGTYLPFGDERFDFVYCVAVMHHIAEPGAVRQTLGEMVRVTRPGGRILIWDHNPRNPYWGRLMARVAQDTGEERLIPRMEIVAGLGAAGASIVECTQRGFVPDFIPPRAIRAAAALERGFERVPVLRTFAAHNVVVAAKQPRGEVDQGPRGTSSATRSPSAAR